MFPVLLNPVSLLSVKDGLMRLEKDILLNFRTNLMSNE